MSFGVFCPFFCCIFHHDRFKLHGVRHSWVNWSVPAGALGLRRWWDSLEYFDGSSCSLFYERSAYELESEDEARVYPH
jgi:hypothetical protein